jgi:hypothetical protein
MEHPPLDPAALRSIFEDFAEILLDVEGCIARLPQAERKRYEECQKSIMEARQSATRIEGLIYVD